MRRRTTMRTTVTLEPDTAALVERAMRERGQSFKQVVNEALRQALQPPGAPAETHTTVYRMGDPAVPLDRALALVAALDDAEVVRELEVGR